MAGTLLGESDVDQAEPAQRLEGVVGPPRRAHEDPFTYMVDAARAATTGPLAFAPVGKALLVGVATLVVTQVAARWAFSRAVDPG